MAGLAGATVVTLAALAAPAAADTAVEVEAGYVEGQIVPGRPIPVRVQVRADQLVTGTITATPYTLGEPGEAVTVPVEVAGGSVKDYLVVVPTEWRGVVGPSEVRVVLRTGDDTVESAASLSWTGNVEVVGLVPGLVSQPPDPVALPMDLGRAVFTELDAQALATPGALGPLGSIVTGPDGVSALPADAQRNVLEWVEAGGQLLVDAPPGSPVAGVPTEWQPAGARAPAGAGWVRLTDGAAARGQWATIIEPSRQFGRQELSGGGTCCFAGVPDSVARDAGLRIPDVGWLLGFLVAYVVVVGPVTFVLLRRVRRTGLAWVAVPAVAVLFTGVAFTAGSSLRSDSRAAHGSVVQASPLGDRAVSYLGLVSRNGGDPTALFPEGWQAGGFDGGDMQGMVFDDMGGPQSVAADAVPIHGDDGRPGVRLPLSSGDFGMVTGRGRVDGDSPLAVTATAAGGTVAGTVTNTAEFDLERVIVVVAGRVADLGDVASGAEVEWMLDGTGPGVNPDPWMAVERPWSDAIGDMGDPNLDSVVNYSVYATEVAGEIDAYPPGVAVAAGWTTDWTPPVEIGSGIAGGRTGFVARTVVDAPAGAVPAAAVRREFVRGPGATRFDPPIQIRDWGEARGAVARFTLPEGADAATPLVLEAGGGVAQAEVWDGRRWATVQLDSDGEAAAGSSGRVVAGGPAVAPVVPVGPPVDPGAPPQVASLPAGANQGGVVYVRVALSPELGSNVLLQVRGAA
ncbi:MAG: hypothetical protein JXA83_01170 [Acidimicrobiales bacterium]|nr:hypothetical protein [Acidimicrobiales bacterium]